MQQKTRETKMQSTKTVDNLRLLVPICPLCYEHIILYYFAALAVIYVSGLGESHEDNKRLVQHSFAPENPLKTESRDPSAIVIETGCLDPHLEECGHSSDDLRYREYNSM